MRKFLAIAMFLAAGMASAVDLTITVPANAVPKAQEMCEQLRQEVRVRSSEWSNDLCATIFTRIGLRVYVDRYERRSQQQIIDAAVQAEIDAFDTDWPLPYVAAFCGDGTWDAEFGEECDDGNNDDGDGCSARCRNE